MINYIEKGIRLHNAISEAGFHLKDNTNDEAYDKSGNQSDEIDSIVQAIIDNFDPVPQLKAELKSQLVIESQEYVNEAILKQYPKFEVDTWQNQLDDAKAHLIDNAAVTLTLDSLANKRGQSKENLANKIIAKFQQFSVFSGNQAGERQRIEDLIDSAETVEALNAIQKFAGV